MVWKGASKELPAPARWWERVAGGDRGKHVVRATRQNNSKAAHMMVSKHLHSHWDLPAVSLGGKEVFFGSALCLEVTLLLLFLLSSALQLVLSVLVMP